MRTPFVAALLILLAASPARAESLSAECVGDSVSFDIGITWMEDTPSGYGLVIEALVLGTCDSPRVVSPEPLPLIVLEPHASAFVHHVTLPAASNTHSVRYQILRVDPQGNTSPAPHSLESFSYAIAACPDTAILGRGRLKWNGNPDFTWSVSFEVCTNECWEPLPTIVANADPALLEYAIAGTLVDLHGVAFVNFMPGGTFLSIAWAEPSTTSTRCDPIAIEIQSWGGLKGQFR